MVEDTLAHYKIGPLPCLIDKARPQRFDDQIEDQRQTNARRQGKQRRRR